jgi:hypothetical protein
MEASQRRRGLNVVVIKKEKAQEGITFPSPWLDIRPKTTFHQ